MTLKQLKRKYIAEGFKLGYKRALLENAGSIYGNADPMHIIEGVILSDIQDRFTVHLGLHPWDFEDNVDHILRFCKGKSKNKIFSIILPNPKWVVDDVLSELREYKKDTGREIDAFGSYEVSKIVENMANEIATELSRGRMPDDLYELYEKDPDHFYLKDQDNF